LQHLFAYVLYYCPSCQVRPPLFRPGSGNSNTLILSVGLRKLRSPWTAPPSIPSVSFGGPLSAYYLICGAAPICISFLISPTPGFPWLREILDADLPFQTWFFCYPGAQKLVLFALVARDHRKPGNAHPPNKRWAKKFLFFFFLGSIPFFFAPVRLGNVFFVCVTPGKAFLGFLPPNFLEPQNTVWVLVHYLRQTTRRVKTHVFRVSFEEFSEAIFRACKGFYFAWGRRTHFEFFGARPQPPQRVFLPHL